MSSCCCQGGKTGIYSSFSPAELKAALSKIQNRKSSGPDGIPNDLFKQLSPTAERHLLTLINKSWTEARTPVAWRKAEIVAIPKKGKPAAETGS